MSGLPYYSYINYKINSSSKQASIIIAKLIVVIAYSTSRTAGVIISVKDTINHFWKLILKTKSFRDELALDIRASSTNVSTVQFICPTLS